MAESDTPNRTEIRRAARPASTVRVARDIACREAESSSGAVAQRALHAPRTLRAREMLQLQRAVGNRAAGALLAQAMRQDMGAFSPASTSPGRRTVPALDIAQKGIEGEDEPIEMEEVAEKRGGGEGGSQVTDNPGVRAHELGYSFQPEVAASWLQRQPAPPAPAPPVVVPAGRATLNFLPILQDKAPAAWGVTAPDRAVLDITAYADGAVWKCKITTADQQTHQGSRLLPGVVEVTPALVAAEADCPKLKTMMTSLKTVANQGTDSGFYMIAAVQAHENLHVTQWQTGMAPHYATLRTAVEALTVPQASHADAAAAKTAIKALPAFTAAMATYRAGETTVAAATASHAPIAPFNAVEHAVVDPMIATIGARRTALKCPP